MLPALGRKHFLQNHENSVGLAGGCKHVTRHIFQKNASVGPAKGPTGENLGNKCAQVMGENAILEGHKSGANADEFVLQVNFDIMKIDENRKCAPHRRREA